MPTKRRNPPCVSGCTCQKHQKHHGSLIHGHTRAGYKSPTYYSWANMIIRCRYPTSPAFFWYGGRGITVCDRWQKFECFLADMGERPSANRRPKVAA